MKTLPTMASLFPTLLLLGSPAIAQAQNLFLQPPTFSCSGQTVTADFNHDGKPDLACQDGSILLGDGDGTFNTGTPWSASGQTGTTQILTADFNGDGKPDLLVTFVFSTSLYVLLGNGDGTFQSAVVTNVGTGLGSPIAVDINDDGKADLLGISGTQLFVLLGKGDGTFAPGVPYPGYNANTIMTVADFNGDGKLDVAQAVGSAPGLSGMVAVFLGNGDGTFQSAIMTPGVDFPSAIKAGDLNGDGKIDLVISNDAFIPTGSSPQTVTLLGNGNGTFQAPGVPFSAPVGNLALLDLNGDAKLDLVVAGDPFTKVFLGNGDGTFTPRNSYLDVDYLGQAGSILTADFNGDGNPDLAFANKILIGNGDGSFKDNPATPVNSSGLRTAVAGNFNNDGIPDVAAISASNAHELYILLNDGTGVFSIAHTYTMASPAYSIATTDLNGDGKLDLVIVTIDPITTVWTLNILLGNGDGTFGAATTYSQTTVSGIVFVIAVVDFNGDRKPDLAILNSQGSGDVTVFLNNGDGSFAPATTLFAGEHANSLVTGDFNNDGKMDIVASSDAGLGLLLGRGDGTFQPTTFPYSPIAQLVATADLNNDGNLDLISGNQILLGNGDGTFAPFPSTVNVSPIAQVADVNCDGKLDLITDPGLQVLLGNGDGTFGSSPVVVFPVANPHFQSNQIAGHFLLTGDFNHDGRTDIVVDAVGQGGVFPAGVVTFLNTAQPPAPDFLISSTTLSPATVAPGGSGTSTVTLASISGFTGGVTLSCTGLPSGATCNFSPSSVTGSGSSMLTITTTSATPLGTYPIGVAGAASTLTHSATVTLAVATSVGATTVTLAPASLSFSQQALGVTSSPQAVQLGNIGSAALTISGFSITGANAGDFALQDNVCATGIAAGASCLFAATFTPTGIGIRTAAISIIDNASGSPHMVALSGAGPDFSITPSSPSAVTVFAGATATYTILITPSGGFNQSVSFTCSGAPALTTCTISPNPITLNGTAAASATVSITTMAASGSPAPFRRGFPSQGNFQRTSFLVVLFAILLILARLGARKRQEHKWTPLAVLTLLLCVAITLSSCGGGSSPTKPTNPGTQAGAYPVTVTGTFMSGSKTSTRVTNLTLIVK